LKLYLDVCCLNRLTDDQSQSRIREEAEAVQNILHLVRLGQVEWVSSSVVNIEIGRNPDGERRRDVAGLLIHANHAVTPAALARGRAEVLTRLGFGAFDALHLACAETAADVFLTTDDELLRRAQRSVASLRVRVENPVSWYREFTKV
jgi:predicted nucleic acid-binding protein